MPLCAAIMPPARLADMGTLVLLRHGESVWNSKGLFTGWVDVGLSEKGVKEAANAALEAADLLWLPVRRSWRLNERHYGALQGKDKAATRQELGDEQFMLWRRSYDVPPPPIADDDPLSQSADPRYAALPPDARPRT